MVDIGSVVGPEWKGILILHNNDKVACIIIIFNLTNFNKAN
jgi:hypothetical protein